jgi:hypothetical protein
MGNVRFIESVDSLLAKVEKVVDAAKKRPSEGKASAKTD